MEKIKLEIQWKLSGNNKENRVIEVPKGIRVDDLFQRVSPTGNIEEYLIAYNDVAVQVDSQLDRDGVISLIPMLIGG